MNCPRCKQSVNLENEGLDYSVTTKAHKHNYKLCANCTYALLMKALSLRIITEDMLESFILEIAYEDIRQNSLTH